MAPPIIVFISIIILNACIFFQASYLLYATPLYWHKICAFFVIVQIIRRSDESFCFSNGRSFICNFILILVLQYSEFKGLIV